MFKSHLNQDERDKLLNIARGAIESRIRSETLEELELEKLPLNLQEVGASFVTITKSGKLRGCIGTLNPTLPLAEDVRDHAIAAAFYDYRFSPIQSDEIKEIKLEISILTEPKPLKYDDPEDLISLLQPGIDGVVINDGQRKATFLPQVWEKLPNADTFMQHLCQKMGANPDYWKEGTLEVCTYQVEEFHE